MVNKFKIVYVLIFLILVNSSYSQVDSNKEYRVGGGYNSQILLILSRVKGINVFGEVEFNNKRLLGLSYTMNIPKYLLSDSDSRIHHGADLYYMRMFNVDIFAFGIGASAGAWEASSNGYDIYPGIGPKLRLGLNFDTFTFNVCDIGFHFSYDSIMPVIFRSTVAYKF